MRLAGVLFDKDGVLVDFDATWGPATARVIQSLAEGDPARAAALAEALRFDLETRRHHPESVFIAGSANETVAVWADILGEADHAALRRRLAAMFTREGEIGVAAPATAGPALAALRARGLPLGVATNDEELSARRQMAKLGFAERFGFIAGADSGHGAKPGPGMVLAFAEHVGVNPERIAMIGDSLHDMRAARAAGAVAVAVGSGPAPLETLAPHADYAIESLEALPALVARIRPA